MKWLQRITLALICLLPVPSFATQLLFEGWEGTPTSIASYPNEWWDTSCTPTGSWPSTSNPGLSTTQVYAGTTSLKRHFTGTQYDVPPHGGCFTSKYFTGAQDIWVTWMELMSPNFTTAGSTLGGSGTKGLYFYAHRPGTSTGQGMVFEYNWGSKNYRLGVQAVYDATPQWDSYELTQNSTVFDMPSSKWVCYEGRVKLNDAGSANGEYQLYATNMTDGGATIQLANYTGKRWRGNNTSDPFPSDAVFNQLKVYTQDGLGDIWWDNIYITTTRQGCSGTPPAADTTPPPVPQVPVVSSAALPLIVTWTGVTNPGDLSGYKYYRKLEACAGATTMSLIATLGNVLTYTDTTIPNATTNVCVKVSSYDSSSNESSLSPGKDVTLTPPAASVRTNTVNDTFTATNSNPLPSPWLGTYPPDVNLQLVSNQAASTSITEDATMIRNEVTPNDQWACAPFSSTLNGAPGILLRFTDPSVKSGYAFRVIGHTSIRIEKWTNNVNAYLGVLSYSFADNETLCGEAEGTSLRLYTVLNGVSSLRIVATDSTYTSGKRGLLIYNSVSNAVLATEFTGGGFTAGTPTSDTFSTTASVALDATGADITFTGLASKIRYWNNLHPRTAPVEVTGLGGVASYRLSKTWETAPVAITFVCIESQGSDGIWESDKVTDSFVCNNLATTSTDSTAPATPSGFGVR